MPLGVGSGPSDVVRLAGVRVVALGSAAGFGQGAESGEDGQNEAGPATARSEVHVTAAGADGKPAGGREQSQPEAFRFRRAWCAVWSSGSVQPSSCSQAMR